MDNTVLALRLAKHVHDNCDNVPHGIGLELAEIVKQWRESAGLIHVDEIYFCPDCGDTGKVKSGTEQFNNTRGMVVQDVFKSCDCRKIPTSLWSIKERVKGK